MKKLMILATMAATAAVSFAEPSWAVVNTVGAGDGTWTDASGDMSRYTAYLCTATAAEEFFGSSSYSAITDYLSAHMANYTSGMGKLAAGGEPMVDYGYDEEEYSFTVYEHPGTLGSDYVAVLAYDGVAGETDMFRVFNGTVVNDRLVFDPAAGRGTAGAWTPVGAVPEPTSGMLVLLGLASLALRRKRGEG